MPAPDPTYGYDPETNMVRVDQHDLAWLLLMFRLLMLMREQKPGRWRRTDDHDLSFERLADAVDAGSPIRYGKRWTGPDLRMRCTTTEAAYTWPNGAPYDREATFTWMVPATARTPPRTNPSGAPRTRRCAGSAGRRATGRAGWKGCRSARSAGAKYSSVPTGPAAPALRCPLAMGDVQAVDVPAGPVWSHACRPAVPSHL